MKTIRSDVYKRTIILDFVNIIFIIVVQKVLHIIIINIISCITLFLWIDNSYNIKILRNRRYGKKYIFKNLKIRI